MWIDIVYLPTFQNTALMTLPDSNVHGANMGPIWGRQVPGGSHVGPMNFAIWAVLSYDYPVPEKYPSLIWVKSTLTSPQQRINNKSCYNSRGVL